MTDAKDSEGTLRTLLADPHVAQGFRARAAELGPGVPKLEETGPDRFVRLSQAPLARPTTPAAPPRALTPPGAAPRASTPTPAAAHAPTLVRSTPVAPVRGPTPVLPSTPRLFGRAGPLGTPIAQDAPITLKRRTSR